MPPSARRLVACGINCPLLAASITGKPASMFNASHCWLLFSSASPRSLSVSVLAVASSVTIRKRSAGCSNHSKVVAPSLTTCFSFVGSSLKRFASGARLKTGNTKQHTFIVWRDGHFREHRIFFSSVSCGSRTLRRSIHAKPSPSRNRRKLLHILPLASQWAASRC